MMLYCVLRWTLTWRPPLHTVKPARLAFLGYYYSCTCQNNKYLKTGTYYRGFWRGLGCVLEYRCLQISKRGQTQNYPWSTLRGPRRRLGPSVGGGGVAAPAHHHSAHTARFLERSSEVAARRAASKRTYSDVRQIRIKIDHSTCIGARGVQHVARVACGPVANRSRSAGGLNSTANVNKVPIFCVRILSL